VWSFIYWRRLRDLALDEEGIYEGMFWATIGGLVAGRTGYVATHWELFGTHFLKSVAFWVEPGLAFYPALATASVILFIIVKKKQFPMQTVADAMTRGFAFAYIIGSLGAFLGNVEAGVLTGGPLGVHFPGMVGLRFPVGTMEAIATVLILFLLFFFSKRFDGYFKIPGMFTLWFILLFTSAEFFLEFTKDTHVYLGSLRLNQWALIFLFGQAVGALLIWGGGKNAIGTLAHSLVREGGRLYAKISKRHTATN
jgi:prolipoprotein diacylglyceryltransferase